MTGHTTREMNEFRTCHKRDLDYVHHCKIGGESLQVRLAPGCIIGARGVIVVVVIISLDVYICFVSFVEKGLC